MFFIIHTTISSMRKILLLLFFLCSFINTHCFFTLQNDTPEDIYLVSGSVPYKPIWCNNQVTLGGVKLSPGDRITINSIWLQPPHKHQWIRLPWHEITYHIDWEPVDNFVDIVGCIGSGMHEKELRKTSGNYDTHDSAHHSLVLSVTVSTENSALLQFNWLPFA